MSFNDGFSTQGIPFVTGSDGQNLTWVASQNRWLPGIGAGSISTAVSTSNGILGNGSGIDPVRLDDSITVQNLTVTQTASIMHLDTIHADSLVVGDKYITLMSGANNHSLMDGAGLLWGSGSTDPSTGDMRSVAYVLYRDNSSNQLEIFPGLKVSGSLTGSNVSFETINVNDIISANISSSNGITGSFYGDGSRLINLPTNIDHVLYVASDGSDTNSGSLTDPFLTIQAAINYATTAYSDLKAVQIKIFPGSYAGFDVSRKNLYFTSEHNNNIERAVRITGPVKITATGGSKSSDVYGFDGLLLSHASALTEPHLHIQGSGSSGVYIQNCQIYTDTADANANAIRIDGNFNEDKVVIRNSVIQASKNGADLLKITGGDIEIDSCKIYGGTSGVDNNTAISASGVTTLLIDRLLLEHSASLPAIKYGGTGLFVLNNSSITKTGNAKAIEAVSTSGSYIINSVFGAGVSANNLVNITNNLTISGSNIYYANLTSLIPPIAPFTSFTEGKVTVANGTPLNQLGGKVFVTSLSASSGITGSFLGRLNGTASYADDSGRLGGLLAIQYAKLVGDNGFYGNQTINNSGDISLLGGDLLLQGDPILGSHAGNLIVSEGANILVQNTGYIQVNNGNITAINGYFSGSGTGISGLTGSNWNNSTTGFIKDVRDQLSGGTGITYNKSTGVISTNDFLGVLTTGSITGSGLAGNEIDLKSSIQTQQITASVGFSGDLYGNATTATTANYATNAGNSSTANSAITAGSATTANYATNAGNASTLNAFSDTDFAKLNVNNSYTGSQSILGSISSSAGITGSFSGDGFSVYNLTGSNWTGSVAGFAKDVRNQIAGGTSINYNPNDGVINWTGEDGGGGLLSSGSITGSGKFGNEFTLKDNVSVVTLSASYGITGSEFSGSGRYIYNLTGSNWINNQSGFKTDVLNQLSGGYGITFDKITGEILWNGGTGSFSEGSITGSGLANNKFRLTPSVTVDNNLTVTNSSSIGYIYTKKELIGPDPSIINPISSSAKLVIGYSYDTSSTAPTSYNVIRQQESVLITKEKTDSLSGGFFSSYDNDPTYGVRSYFGSLNGSTILGNTQRTGTGTRFDIFGGGPATNNLPSIVRVRFEYGDPGFTSFASRPVLISPTLYAVNQEPITTMWRNYPAALFVSSTASYDSSVTPSSSIGAAVFQSSSSLGTASVRITQYGQGDSLIVEDETRPDGTPFIIKNNGDVGIGLLNPTAKLHVVGDVLINGSLTGSAFSGSGINITNITASNIDRFTNDVRVQLSGQNGINYDPSTGIISIVEAGGITTQGSITGSGTAIDPLKLTNAVTASYFTGSFVGDGSQLTNLSGSQFPTWGSDVRNVFVAGAGISITTIGGGQYQITSSGGTGGEGITEVNTTGSITGSGLPDNKIRLKDDIIVTTVTASGFSGSGLNLTDLSSSQFTTWNSDVRNVFVAGDAIAINQVNGKYAISSSVLTSGSITGSGVFGNEIRLKDYVTASGLFINHIDLNTDAAAPTDVKGRINYNLDFDSVEYHVDGLGNSVMLGQQFVQKVKNVSGITLSKGKVVHPTVSNSNADFPHVTTASIESDEYSANTMGVVLNDIAMDGEGYIITQGVIRGLDTDAYTVGTVLYLGTGGTITNVKTTAPNHLVTIGQVTRAAQNGSIYVKIQNGYELEELHDVYVTGEQNGDLLSWNINSSRWQNGKTLTGHYEVVGGLTASTFYSPLSNINTAYVTNALTASITLADLSYAKIKSDNEFTASATNTFKGPVNLEGITTFTEPLTGSSALLSKDLTVIGTASIGFLKTVNQENLQIGNKYITILSGANDHNTLDGSGILWGSGSVDGTTGDQQSAAYLLYRGIGTTTDYLEAFPGLRVSGSAKITEGLSVTGSISSTGTISGSVLYGSGTGIIGVIADAAKNTNIVMQPPLINVEGIIVKGNVVAISGSCLCLADNSDARKSNAFGIVYEKDTGTSPPTYKITTSGIVSGSSAVSFVGGDLVYVDGSGLLTNYESIGSGKYVTQVGIANYNVSTTGEIILQQRIYGQKA